MPMPAEFYIERDNMREKRLSTYTVLEDCNFHFDLRQVLEFDFLWRNGISGDDIAQRFGRDPDEIFLLAMDRKRAGKIEDRPGGWYGNQYGKEIGKKDKGKVPKRS
jgi:hypothetical protein